MGEPYNVPQQFVYEARWRRHERPNGRRNALPWKAIAWLPGPAGRWGARKAKNARYWFELLPDPPRSPDEEKLARAMRDQAKALEDRIIRGRR
jgi:hypothetical protein